MNSKCSLGLYFCKYFDRRTTKKIFFWFVRSHRYYIIPHGPTCTPRQLCCVFEKNEFFAKRRTEMLMSDEDTKFRTKQRKKKQKPIYLNSSDKYRAELLGPSAKIHNSCSQVLILARCK